MIPTGAGKVGMRIGTPDGEGVVTIVHNQDNVTVTLDKGKGLPKPIFFVGDVNECDGWCEDCKKFHSFGKHDKVVA